MKYLTKLTIRTVSAILISMMLVMFWAGNMMVSHASPLNETEKDAQINYEMVKDKWGAEALALYKKGVLTGDYYDFRAYTGHWGGLVGQTFPKGNTKQLVETTMAEHYSEAALRYMGPYATAQDFIDHVNACGYSTDPNASNYYANADLPTYEELIAKYKKLTKKLKTPTHKTFTVMPYDCWVDGVMYHKGDPAPYASAAPATAAVSDPKVEALKSYKGNNNEFNAYHYYMNYADLQAAIGANGDLLLQHYNQFGKNENRIANRAK
jgi:hypothetical protein